MCRCAVRPEPFSLWMVLDRVGAEEVYEDGGCGGLPDVLGMA